MLGTPTEKKADRIDLQVQKNKLGHSVAKVRWNVDWNNDVPPIGTIVTVEGEVSEWNGGWLQIKWLWCDNRPEWFHRLYRNQTCRGGKGPILC